LEGGRKGRPPPPPLLLLVVVAWPLKAVSSHREKVRELAAWAWPKPRKVKEEADGREEDVDVDEKERKKRCGQGIKIKQIKCTNILYEVKKPSKRILEK
jgi:hypothetical protein